MKEYTIISMFSVLLAIAIDRISGVRLLSRGRFYLFLWVIILFKLLVNGYLTGVGIVRYNPFFFMGLRIGSIPVEDFLFGFSMVTLTIVTWEYCLKEAR